MYSLFEGQMLQYAPSDCNCHLLPPLRGGFFAANSVTFAVPRMRLVAALECKTVTLGIDPFAGNP